MLHWIDSRPDGRRFFLTYLPIAGHHPYATPAPGPFPGDPEAWQYRNALHYADAALGELLAGLRARGLETNTLFVLFGDHGEAFGQHEGNYGHTLFLYEENIRVPCLIAAPGLLREQVRIRRTASLVDLAPTMLDLVGLEIPSDYQGTSLLRGAGSRMALFYTDYAQPLVGLRDGSWKFIHELDSGRSKLFDLQGDPGETANRAVELPERVAAYRLRLEQWCRAQKGSLRAGRRRRWTPATGRPETRRG
jgi:arylsulfatase A-like enzyme